MRRTGRQELEIHRIEASTGDVQLHMSNHFVNIPNYSPTTAHTPPTIQTMESSERPTQAVTDIQSRTQPQTENEQSLMTTADSKLVQTANITHILFFHDAERRLHKYGARTACGATSISLSLEPARLWMMHMLNVRVETTLNIHIWRNVGSNVSTSPLTENVS